MTFSALIFIALASQSPGEDLMKQAFKALGEGKSKEAHGIFLQAFTALEGEGATQERQGAALKGAGDAALSYQDFVAAEASLSKATNLYEKPPSSKATAFVYVGLHVAQRGLGRFSLSYGPLDTAIQFFAASAPGSEDHWHHALLKAYNLRADRRPKDSVDYAKSELAPLVEKHFRGSVFELDLISHEANCNGDLKNPQRALELLEKVVKANVSVRPGSLRWARSLRDLGNFRISHDSARAITELETARDAFTTLGVSQLEVGQIFWYLADAYKWANKGAQSVQAAESCWRIFNRISQSTPAPRIEPLGNGTDPGNAARSVMEVFILFGQQDKALQVLQDIQGRQIQKQFFQVIRNASATSRPELVRVATTEALLGQTLQAATLKDLQRDAAERSLRKAEALGEPTASLEGELNKAEAAAINAKAAYARSLASFDQAQTAAARTNPGLFSPTFPLQDTGKYLGKNSLYLGYFLGSAPFMQIVVLTPGGRLRMENLSLDVFQLREQVNQVRAKLQSRNPSVYDDLRELYTILVPTSICKEVEAAESLVITPDGPLWEMPFAALLAGPDSEPYYLGLAKPIVITPSLSLYGMAQEAGKQKKAAAQITASIIGDPLFSAKGENQLASSGERSVLWAGDKAPPQLPGTKKEAEAIAALYGTQAVTGDKATETLVRSQLKSAQILHIATHGYVNNDYPMASGLLLAAPKSPPSNPGGDGALLAWEVFQSPSSSPHLVVLSACETGLGRSLRAEGVDGLVRSFQVSGVPSIISSLWKVDDESTSLLMTELHRQVRAGKPYHEAVRQAMIAVYTKPETQEPYFWAPFFLVGDQTNRLFSPK